MRLFDTLPLNRKGRSFVAAVLTAAFAFGMVSAANGIDSITVFKNSLKNSSNREEVRQIGGGSCKRGGASKAFRAKVGKRTRECSFRVQMVGRDLEVTASGRLFKATPEKLRSKAFVAVNLRHAKDGSRYQLAVYPGSRRFQMRKYLDDGKVENLAGGKLGNKVKGLNMANRLSLRAYNDLPGQAVGSARIVARVNGKRVSVFDDARGGQLKGRDTSFSIGSNGNATGAIGSFVNLSIRVPDPFK